MSPRRQFPNAADVESVALAVCECAPATFRDLMRASGVPHDRVRTALRSLCYQRRAVKTAAGWIPYRRVVR